MTTKAKTKRDSKVVGSLPMTMKASDEELLIAAYQAADARDPLTVQRPGSFEQGSMFFGGVFE